MCRWLNLSFTNETKEYEYMELQSIFVGVYRAVGACPVPKDQKIWVRIHIRQGTKYFCCPIEDES